MKPVLDRVAETILRYSMAPSGCRLGVAVSGGADSVFLLHALRELAPRWDLRLTVLHLNHQLRGEESDEDARFVEGMAQAMELPVIAEKANLGAGNLEEEAREARLAFFARSGMERIATGHTMDDQAETVLYRLMRGSGTAGLAGVLPVSYGSPILVRPLLWLRRAEIEEFLREREIPWREDKTNLDRTFVRNRIRHELMPLLRSYNPSIAATLAQTAALAQDEEDFWARRIDELMPVLRRGRHSVLVDAADLRKLAPAVARRLIRRGVQMVKGDLRAIGAAHIEAILALGVQEVGHGRLQVPGLDIFRSFDLLRIGFPKVGSRQDRDYDLPMPVPGGIALPGTSLEIHADLIDMPKNEIQAYNRDIFALDAARVNGPLRIRNWRPGDRYTPAGEEEKKIKFLFQEARVPIWERQPWPVITFGDRIVWVRMFGPAADCAPGEQTHRVIRISERGELS